MYHNISILLKIKIVAGFCHSMISNVYTGRFSRFSQMLQILEKWFPLWGERAHSLKLFCMYDKRFEI